MAIEMGTARDDLKSSKQDSAHPAMTNCFSHNDEVFLACENTVGGNGIASDWDNVNTHVVVLAPPQVVREYGTCYTLAK